jgi:RHS repeat-associated protein
MTINFYDTINAKHYGRSYKVTPAWDVDGDGKLNDPDTPGALGFGHEISAWFPETPTTLDSELASENGYSLGIQARSGIRRKTFSVDDPDLVEDRDDSVHEIAVDPATGLAKVMLTSLDSPIDESTLGYLVIGGHLATSGTSVEGRFTPGEYSLSTSISEFRDVRLQVSVTGASMILQPSPQGAGASPEPDWRTYDYPTGYGGVPVADSGGIEGITNPRLFPLVDIDWDAVANCSRITRITMNEVDFPGGASPYRRENQWFQIERSHAFDVLIGEEPVFANLTDRQTDLPQEPFEGGPVEGSGTEFYLRLYKDDDAGIIMKVNGANQRSFRYLKFSGDLGPQNQRTPQSQVIPRHAWITHGRDNFYFTATCVEYTTPNLSPNVYVHYNSMDNLECGLGRGWRTNYDMRVYRVKKYAVLVDETSARIAFPDGRNSESRNGAYLAAKLDEKSELEEEDKPTDDFRSGEKYRVTKNDNHTYFFNNDGWLVRVRNLRGEELTVARNAQGYAQSVTDSHQRTQSLTRSAFGGGSGEAPLTTLNRGKSGAWEFQYSDRGSMTSIVSNGNYSEQTPGMESVTYKIDYDDQNRPTRFGDDANAALQTAIDYPVGEAHAIQITQPYGIIRKIYHTGFTYKDISHSGSLVVDSHNVASFSSPGLSFIAPSTDSSPYFNKDELRQVETRTYDAVGNLIRSQRVLDATTTHETSWRYEKLTFNDKAVESSNLLRSHTEHAVTGLQRATPTDLTTTWTYYDDAEARLGLLAHQIAADGSISSYTYDAQGRLATQTDARGVTWSFTNHVPDGAGQPGVGLPRRIEIVELENPKTAFERVYFEDGALREHKDVRWDYTTVYRYDAQGNLEGVLAPGQTQEEITKHDPLGRVIYRQDVEGLKQYAAYDSLNRLVRTVVPGRSDDVTTFADTGTGYRATTKRGTLILADQVFDASGRLQKDVAHRELVGGQAGVTTCETIYHYDQKFGWLNEVEDPLQRKTSFQRDHAGRVLKTTTPLQATVTTTYNGLGWPLTVTDPDGNTRKSVYSEIGQVRFDINPAGGWIETRYDPSGQVVAVLPSQGKGTSYEYRSDGSLSRVTDRFGNRVEHTPTPEQRAHAITINGIAATKRTVAYNPRALPESVSNATLGKTDFVYHDDGSIDTVTRPGRGPVTRLRDDAHRTKGYSAVVTLDGNVDETIENTVERNPTSGAIESSENHLKHKQKHLASNVTGEVNEVQDNAHSGSLSSTSKVAKVLVRDANGNVTRYEDALGQMTEQTFDHDQRLKTRYHDGVMTAWFYLPSGLVDYVTRAGVQKTDYGYNALGLVTSRVVTGRSAQTTQYDTLGRKTQHQDGVLATSYFYDQDTGVLTQTLSSDGRSVTYRYDSRGRQTSVTDNRGNGRHLRYDDLDRVTRITHMDGKYEAFTYLPTGEVETKRDRAGKTKRFAYDPSGNVRLTTHETDGTVKTHSRSLPATGGAVTTTTYAGHSQTTTTDVRGRTTQVSRTGMTDVAMTYNAANKLTSKSGDSFGYNDAGQLTLLQRPGQPGITFAYNARGLLAEEVLPNAVRRTYTYDDAGDVASITQTVGSHTETWNVSRDGQGRIVAVTHPLHTQAFTYDDRGRLVSEEHQETGFSGITHHAYDVSDNRVATVAFSGAQSGTLAFSDGSLPAQVVPNLPLAWQVLDQAGQNVLSAAQNTPGLLRASMDLHDAPAFLVPTLSVRVTSAAPTGQLGRTGAGLGMTTASGDAYQALWERSRTPPGSFDPTQGRIVIQRIAGDTGEVTTLATSAYLTENGVAVTLTVALTPDGRMTARALSPGLGILRAEAQTTGLDSRTFTGTCHLVAMSADEPISSTFDDVTWTTADHRKATSASYNAFNQLVSEEEVDSQTGGVPQERTYEYDDLGSQTRITTTVNGSVGSQVGFSYDALDRLASLTANGQTSQFTYFADSWMRLSATTDSLTRTWTYDDRQVTGSTISVAGGPPTVTAYLHHQGTPLLETTGATTSVYARDPLGNIVGHLGAYQTTQETLHHYTRRFSYDAYGVITREQMGQVDPSTQQVEFPSLATLSAGPRYKGMWFDAGPTALHKTQTRSYAANLGRFTQMDPAQAGMNWYAYCGGDPVNRSDPSGLDWRWNGSDWDYEPGTNPFVPYPLFKPTGSEFQEYTYIDAEKYVQLRQRQPTLDALRGEGTGVVNNYGYGSLFESPYKHWDKIPAADILNAYRTSVPEGAQFNIIPSTIENLVLTGGTSAEEAGVILYGRRLSRANGTLDVGASAEAAGQLSLSGFEKGVWQVTQEYQREMHRLSREWAIAQVRGEVEILQGITSLAIPGAGVASLGREVIGEVTRGAVRGMASGLRGLAPRLNPANYEFPQIGTGTMGTFGYLPRYRGYQEIRPSHPLLARAPQHHLFPQAEREWFKARGVDIDKYTIRLDQGTHSALHHGQDLFGPGGWWNARIMERLRQAEGAVGRQLTPREILIQGARLRREVFPLDRLPVEQYGVP